ncbi:MAG: MATE family efflux transporter [Candidatus Marinimicrobia bacterium]|jgi:putative MATE family efflux protein|nr:MATE family efflux transporter [Candidatus Neomarinimicrobiota bacterium]MBT4361511.1 MATE family efflux transporter [Candidatus Neomarinimicrobiota bacterium]MBT4713949.1 MATE family efflux transporter [Candidatus Neomarinimicrobiota bacterium]MBT4946452.1 MATE family efflux transporter [Candidatus Neomarinimicrobiota bacterium]MBT5269556.1 MATE family efflux transporter [Candidatus Neomarinimicrobiota bacterium]
MEKANTNSKTSRLDSFIDNPRKAIWTLGLPVMTGMAVQTLYSIVDMLFVARISVNAIAALGFNLPLFWMAMGISFGLGTGVTAVIARFIGARDHAAATNVAEHGLLLGLIIGGAFSTVGLLFGEEILIRLGTPDELMADTLSYFQVIAGGFIFMITGIFLRSIFSGEGDTKTPVKIQVTSTIINIILDPILIFGFDMGVRGAALATVLSMIVAVVMYSRVILFKKVTLLQLNLKYFKYKSKFIKDIFRIGIPSSLSMIIMSLGAALFNWILVHYSPEVIAGYQIAGRLDQIFFLPIMAIAGSLVTLVGMFYGAQRFDLINSVIKDGLRYGIFIGLGSGLLFYIIAPYVFRIFTDDPTVLAVAVSIIRTFSPIYWLIAIGMISGRALQGLGTGIPSLVITAIRVAVVSGPLAYYFAVVLDKPYVWVWYASVIAVFIAAGTSLTWLFVRSRRVQREVKAQAAS